MNKLELEGKWNQIKGSVKQKFGDWFDNDDTSLEGKFEEIVGKMNFLDMYSKQESQGFEDRARWIFDRRESFIKKEDKLLSKTGKPECDLCACAV